MGGDRDAIVAQIAQLIEHPDPTQKPLWDGSGLPETAAEMLELDMEDLKRKVTLMLSQALGPADAAPDHPVDHPDPDNGTPAELVTTLADIVTAPDDQAELQANLRRLEALRTEPVGGLRGLSEKSKTRLGERTTGRRAAAEACGASAASAQA